MLIELKQNSKLFLCVIITVVFISSCNRMNKLELENLPLPANVKTIDIGGAEKEKFNNAVSSSLLAIKGKYKLLENKVYELPADNTQQEIQSFYDEKLKLKGFVRQNEQPLQTVDSKLVFWRSENFSGQDIFAVAFIEIENEGVFEKYLLISTAQ